MIYRALRTRKILLLTSSSLVRRYLPLLFLYVCSPVEKQGLIIQLWLRYGAPA